MHLLILRFAVPKSKLHEFDLALDRLVKWPVFRLRSTAGDQYEIFEFIRSWQNKESMQLDLTSSAFKNLVGAVKVLGNVEQSSIYTIAEQVELNTDNY
jgi:hypothetical protein